MRRDAIVVSFLEEAYFENLNKLCGVVTHCHLLSEFLLRFVEAADVWCLFISTHTRPFFVWILCMINRDCVHLSPLFLLKFELGFLLCVDSFSPETHPHNSNINLIHDVWKFHSAVQHGHFFTKTIKIPSLSLDKTQSTKKFIFFSRQIDIERKKRKTVIYRQWQVNWRDS